MGHIGDYIFILLVLRLIFLIIPKVPGIVGIKTLDDISYFFKRSWYEFVGIEDRAMKQSTISIDYSYDSPRFTNYPNDNFSDFI